MIKDYLWVSLFLILSFYHLHTDLGQVTRDQSVLYRVIATRIYGNVI